MQHGGTAANRSAVPDQQIAPVGGFDLGLPTKIYGE